MTLLQTVMMSVFDVVGYVIISKNLLRSRGKKAIYYLRYVVIFSGVTALFTINISQEYTMFLNGLVILYMLYLLYKREIIETIYLYLLSTVIILSLQLLSIIILGLLGTGIEYTFWNGMLAQILAILLVTLGSYYLPIHLMFEFFFKDNKVFKFLVANLFVVLLTVLFYWHIDIGGMIENILSIAILSTGIIFVNFVLLDSGLKNQYEEQQLKVYEKYLPVIDELIKELRKRQHEFDNHIQAVRMLAFTSTNYQEILNAMKEYTEELEIKNDLGPLIKLENKLLAGFLYSKKKLAEELSIDFQIVIQEYYFSSKLKDFELVELLGNLINNAFETGIDSNIVKVILSKEKDMYVIEVSNKHPYLNQEKINILFKKGFSTKSNKDRGYGLYNLKEIVNKYNGEIEITNEKYKDENYVVFKVLIP
ncbi:GHKL domain-containing protein [Anaerovirgula multivorans]|uniref:GHKL domain-containing protein n=1 Tax=Anaerovirgula multivorans TaxID=312168 RepID=A0A239KIA0_9FIRM|nr:GHKL domain-containing protein [Anaerovirgula multivorans]SNT17730.1 GHKL domain-containing protein [Anaerovirgula multivorans]